MGATIHIPKNVDLSYEKSLPLDASDTISSNGSTRLETCKKEIARIRHLIREVGEENGIDENWRICDEKKK